jgi:hypothetical protein
MDHYVNRGSHHFEEGSEFADVTMKVFSGGTAGPARGHACYLLFVWPTCIGDPADMLA